MLKNSSAQELNYEFVHKHIPLDSSLCLYICDKPNEFIIQFGIKQKNISKLIFLEKPN